MLGVKTYDKKYIAACRARGAADLAAYHALLAAAKPKASTDKKLAAATEIFEAAFFNNMVLVLDECFVHRLRTVEGKDGNPLNEVRVLCNSMLLHGNVMTADPAIKLTPEKSITKYSPGDTIALDEPTFTALSTAFFAEIERKYV